MARGQKFPVFDGIALKLIDMFHINKSSKTLLGNTVRLSLKTASGRIEDKPPSLDNLCIHFDLYEPIYEFKSAIGQDGHMMKDWQEHSMYCDRKYKFLTERYIAPIRRALEANTIYPQDPRLWFYCLPLNETFVRDPSSGELQYHWNAQSFVLALLPKTVKAARERYRCTKAEIQVLARQVAWLTTKFCQWHRITSKKEADKMLGDWTAELSVPELQVLVHNEIKKIVNG